MCFYLVTDVFCFVLCCKVGLVRDIVFSCFSPPSPFDMYDFKPILVVESCLAIKDY